MKLIEKTNKLLANILKFSPLLVFLFVMTIEPANADILSDRLNDVSAATDSESLVNSIISLAMPIAVFALFGLGAGSAFQMLTSQGNPEKLKEARETITNAVLGFLVIALSVAILLLIQDVLQIPGLNP